MRLKKCLFLSIVIMLTTIAQVAAQSEAYQLKKNKQLAERSIFQDEIDGKYPDHIVYQDKYVVAFKSNSPQMPVHILIVPRKRIPSINELTRKDRKLVAKMLLVAQKLAQQLGIDQTGYRLVFNTNEDAGQSVFHLHLHLLGGHKTGPMVDQTWRNQRKPTQ